MTRAIARAAGAVSTRAALSTSAISAGIAASRAALAARLSAARAAFIRKRPDRDAGDHQLACGPRRGRKRRKVALVERALRSSSCPRSSKRRSRGCLRARHWRGRHALRASLAPYRALSLASSDRARRERSRPRRRRSAPAPPPLSGRSRVPRAATVPSRDRIAKLRHGDAAQRQRRRIVAQSDAVERAERITLRERTPCRRDQRVHRNPDTLVTPLIAPSGPKSISRHLDDKGEKTMTKHPTGTRQEWLAARLDLLRAEKELTHRSDAVARQRQALPWVRIEKEYVFDTDGGKRIAARSFRRALATPRLSLHVRARLVGGLPVLLDDRGRLQRAHTHLAHHDVMLWAVSRAPLSKLQAYKKRMGWSFPWASSSDSDFNFDYDVCFHGGAAARRRHRIQLRARQPCHGYGAGARAGRQVRRELRHRRAPPIRAIGPA